MTQKAYPFQVKEQHEYNFKYFCYRYCLNDYSLVIG